MIRPGDGTICIIDSAEMLLPEPLSPTMPTLSPARRSMSSPCTAWMVLYSILNETCRSRTSRRGAVPSAEETGGAFWAGSVSTAASNWTWGRGHRAGRRP